MSTVSTVKMLSCFVVAVDDGRVMLAVGTCFSAPSTRVGGDAGIRPQHTTARHSMHHGNHSCVYDDLHHSTWRV